MKRFVLIFSLSLFPFFHQAQQLVHVPEFLNLNMEKGTSESILTAMQALITQTTTGTVDAKYLSSDLSALTLSTLQNFINYEANKAKDSSADQDKQLINLYPIGNDQYSLSIAYATKDASANPVVLFVLNLIATVDQGNVTFAIPLRYNTRYWQTTTVGNVTYHHRGKLNKKRAKAFDKNHTLIARKMKQEPEKLDFYLCDNRQEILALQGYEYSIELNGDARNGYGVDAGTIFSVMSNEDFSHDIFHYYSGKIHERINRNWITEEGIAYLWGNAYYTDADGEMITHSRLVDELRKYLKEQPDTDLVTLFTSNQKVLTHVAPEVSVRSTISGVIAREIEKQKGMEGIFTLINCGRPDRENKYFGAIEQLLGITRANFNERVAKLIADY